MVKSKEKQMAAKWACSLDYWMVIQWDQRSVLWMVDQKDD